MILGADSSLGGRIETGIGAIVVHQLRVLQNEGPSPGRRFSCPLFVGYDNKRLNLPSRCITYEFFKTRVLAQVEGLLVPFLVGYDNKRLNLPSRCITYEFFKTRVLAQVEG